MTGHDFAAVARAALAHADALVAGWLPGGRREGDEYVVRNPKRADRTPGSFKVNTRTGAWADFATGDAGGDLVALRAWLDGASQIEAARALAGELGLGDAAPAPKRNGHHPPAEQGEAWEPILPVPDGAPAPPAAHPRLGRPVHVAEYRDAEGRLLGVIHRYEPPGERKQILPLILCADGTRLSWRWRGFPKPRPLYGLDLLAQRPDAPAVVVEGELKCDAGRRLIGDRAVVVAWPGGSKAVRHVDWSPLAGRQVAIWPDADEPGIEAARWIADELRRVGARKVGIVNPPAGVSEGWDLADAEREGWPAEQVLAHIREGTREPLALRRDGPGPDSQPAGPPDDPANGASEPAAADRPDAPVDVNAELKRLAALTPIEYDRERIAVADRLGVRASTLDREVEALRDPEEAATGRGVSLPEAEPWPRPVAGAELLAELAEAIRRHVVLPKHVADVVAAWSVHTWLAERFQHTPRLGITSPTKRCGKSTLLQVLALVCRRVLKADNVSASGVFRTVEALSPLTLLIDEADTFLRENEELRGVLNSGFERGGEVIRVVEINDEHRPIRFRTFAPCAIAAIGVLPATIEDRSIPIVMQRRSPAEQVEKLRAPGARDRLAELASMCARWAADHGPLLDLDPKVPEVLGDREGDVSVPLLAIADAAGADWPRRVRDGLMAIFGHRQADERVADFGTLLLADIRSIFLELSATRLPSAEIVDRLTRMEHRPWPEWRRGKPMSAPQLARALAPFGIRPGTIRTHVGADQRGYYREAFEEAWAHYLPQETPRSPVAPPSEPPHRHSQGNSRASGDFRTATPDTAWRFENGLKPAENLASGGVAARTPPLGVEGGSAGGNAPLDDDEELM